MVHSSEDCSVLNMVVTSYQVALLIAINLVDINLVQRQLRKFLVTGT